jgi:hypothetical protein
MKKSFFMCMVAAVLVSCSKSVFENPVPADGLSIRLKSDGYFAWASTRVPFEGAFDANNVLTALVPARTTSGDYSAPHALGTMTFNDNRIAATYDLPLISGSSEFPVLPSEEVFAFGVYPAANWTRTNNGIAKYTFDGKTDVMGAREVKITKAEVTAGTYQTLAFNHLLTKLKVKLRREGSYGIDKIGKIKSIEWVADDAASGNLKNLISFTALDATTLFDFASPAVKSLGFYMATESAGVPVYTDNPYSNRTYELTQDFTLQAYALVASVNATQSQKNEYFLRVVRTIGGADQTNYIPFDLMGSDNKTPFTGSTAGRAFTVLVNYMGNQIKAIATVTDWVDEGEYVSGVQV